MKIKHLLLSLLLFTANAFGVAVVDEHIQWQDTNGKPIVNGYIYIGEQNQNPVTNPITIYSDRNLSTPISNPQRTDAYGRSVNKIWIPGRYSIRVDNSSNVQKFIDLDRGEDPPTGTVKLTNVQGANTITAEGAGELIDGQTYIFQAVADNTTAVTLNPDSLGAFNIVHYPGVNIGGGTIFEDEFVTVIWDEENSEFLLLSNSPKIRSSSNEDINLAPHGTGQATVTLGGITVNLGYPPNYISGFVVTNATTDADHDVHISAGSARNDDDDLNLSLAADTDRATDTLWAEGGPGLMAEDGTSGNPIALPTSGTVHFFVISKDADGTLDYCSDTSATGANIGTAGSATAGWTVERRIGSLPTNSSANLVAVIAGEISGGGVKISRVTVQDADLTPPGTSANTVSLSVPIGIQVDANITVLAQDLSYASATAVLVTEIAQTGTAPSVSLYNILLRSASTDVVSDSVALSVRTNTSGQIRVRQDSSTADHTTDVTTHGWIDQRR